MTVLLKAQPPREAADKKKARELDGADFIGIDRKATEYIWRLTHFSHMSDPVFAISQDLIPPKEKKTVCL